MSVPAGANATIMLRCTPTTCSASTAPICDAIIDPQSPPWVP